MPRTNVASDEGFDIILRKQCQLVGVIFAIFFEGLFEEKIHQCTFLLWDLLSTPMQAMENSRQTLDDHQGDLQTGSQAYDVASMPGFRFQPTEEELVGFYLRSMVIGNRLEVELINVLDLYRYDPWELPAMAFMQGEREWLFFCPRDKKYPNGARPNRVTASGYWKATGTDRQVRRAQDSRCIGLKKTLVFYTGKAPKGCKTEWIMNEYRLHQNEQNLQKSSIHRDPKEVALCRIYKKPGTASANLCADLMTEDLGLQSPYSSRASKLKDPGAALPSKTTIFPHTSSDEASSERKSSCLTSPSSKLVNLAPRKHTFLDEMDKISNTEATSPSEPAVTTCCQQAIVPNQYDISQIQTSCSRSVKMESGDLSSVVYPVPPAEDNGNSTVSILSAQLMEEEARRGRSVFHNSPAQIRITSPLTDHTCKTDLGISMSTPGVQSQIADQLTWLPNDAHLPPSCSNLTTISSIDRLLKASMWSPLSPPTPAAKDGDLPHFSSQFVWNSHPPWLNYSAPPAWQALLQIQGQCHSTK